MLSVFKHYHLKGSSCVEPCIVTNLGNIWWYLCEALSPEWMLWAILIWNPVLPLTLNSISSHGTKPHGTYP